MSNPRLDQLFGSPFLRLDALLNDVAPAAGKAPILMSVGEPQHPVPAIVATELAKNTAAYGRYPPVAGTPDFRRAVADWLNRRFDLPQGLIEPDSCIAPVAGTREGLFIVAQVVVPPKANGKQPAVLMPNPFYHAYVAGAVMSGGEPVLVSATAENDFLPDYLAVEPEILDRTALVYLCSPANPQGTVARLDYLERMVRLAQERNFVLLSDECYSEVYDEVPPAGMLQAAARSPQGLKNVLVFNSLSKRSSVPGLRSGFIAGDPALIKAFMKLRMYSAPGIPVPLLEAATALWRDEAHVLENRAMYREKFHLAERILSNRLGYFKPGGGFFLWLDVGDSAATTVKLWRDAALKVVPGAYLGMVDRFGVNPGERYIRVALVHDRNTTEAGLHRLADTLGQG
jgi:N-succinyldiaminopimelate aminotransferase